MTSAPTNWMTASPSVWELGTCRATIVSPFQWNVTSDPNVTTGSATGGACWVRPTTSLNWAGFIRRRTLSWATISAPALPKFSLPPVWSPCQWVFTTNRTGFGVTARMAARIFSDSGAN